MRATHHHTRTLALLFLGASACTSAAEPRERGSTTGGEHEARASALAEPTILAAFEGEIPMPMPRAVTSFGAAAHQGAIYTLGGYFGVPHHYVPEHQSGALSRLELSPGAQWETLHEDALGIQGAALVSDESGLLKIGGNRVLRADGASETGAGMRSLDEVARWSPQTQQWQSLQALPQRRSSHGAVTVDAEVYVVGGWSLDMAGPSTAAWMDTMAVLDLASDSWRSVEAPFQRRALGVAAAGRRVFAIGGLTPEGEVSRRVDIYDVDGGTWSRGPDFPADTFGLAAVGRGDVVYASARDGVVRRLDASAQGWEEVARLAFPRFFHQLVAGDEGRLIALGGISDMHTAGRTRWSEFVPVDRSPSGPSFAAITLASPMQAKNRQGVFLHGDTLVVFGGNSSLEQHDFEAHRFQSETWAFHLPSLSWTRRADFLVARQTMQTEVVDAQGLSVGGFGHDGEVARSHPEVFSYDLAADAWTAREGGLPGGGRTQFGLVHHQGQLWVFGGLDYDPSREGEEAFAHLTAILSAPVADASVGFSESGVDLPGPRRAFAGAMLGDEYVMCGGMREGFQLVDGCIAFDFEARTFRELASPRRTRLSADLVALGGRLYLVGGSYREGESMQTDPSLEVYDPASDTWRVALETIPMELRHARALAYGERILIYSAHLEEAQVRIALITP